MTEIRDKRPDTISPGLFTTGDPLGNFNNNCKNDKAVWTAEDCAGLEKLMSSSDESNKCIVIKEIKSENFAELIGERYAQVLCTYNI